MIINVFGYLQKLQQATMTNVQVEVNVSLRVKHLLVRRWDTILKSHNRVYWSIVNEFKKKPTNKHCRWKNENLHNYLHNCVLHWKEKQIRNTSVQQNQLHKNHRRVISNIRCFLFKERMNTEYNPGYKKLSKAKSPKWGSNDKWSKNNMVA